MPTITEDKPLTLPPPPVIEILPETVSRTDRHLAPRYAVVLHNDDVNTMEWVIEVLQKVFGYSVEKCVSLMLDAHVTGKSAVWVGDFEIAEHHADQIVSYGPDPRRVAAGAKPLRVTLEPVD